MNWERYFSIYICINFQERVNFEVFNTSTFDFTSLTNFYFILALDKYILKLVNLPLALGFKK